MAHHSMDVVHAQHQTPTRGSQICNESTRFVNIVMQSLKAAHVRLK